jgi:uncharacterized protein YjbI with pentapeptide repeats
MVKFKDAQKLIKKSARTWNAAAQKIRNKEFDENADDPSVVIEGIDFVELDLKDFDFSFLTFVSCTFRASYFSSCRWENTKFQKCKLHETSFSEGLAEYLSFDDCDLENCGFQDIAMGEGVFDRSRFKNTDFDLCHWDGDEFNSCVFMHTVILRSSFEEVSFDSCRFHFCNLWDDTFRGCSFHDLSLQGTDFMNIMGNSSLRFPVDHEMADVVLENERTPDGSKFFSCTFSKSGLDGLDFGQSDLHRSFFSRCNLRGANLSQCSRLSAGAFVFCDLGSAALPENVNFKEALIDLRELGGSFQRLTYWCVVFCISTIVASLSQLPGVNTIRVPLMGWELAADQFALAMATITVALQLMIMIRAENIASYMNKMPSMLPDDGPLPSRLRDTFIADLAWKFSAVSYPHPSFAPRSYSLIAVAIGFIVIYFQFPMTVSLLLQFAFAYSQTLLVKFSVFLFLVFSIGLAIWGAISLARSFDGRNVFGNEREEFN